MSRLRHTTHHVPTTLPLLAVAAATLLSGCITSAMPRLGDGQALTLSPGQRARLDDGSTLHYVGIVEDSRCPPDVQCVWAGDAALALRWQATGDVVRELRLHTNTGVGPDRARLAARTVILDTVGRAPADARLRVEPSP
ncbi:MAG: hypothetical protein Q4F49_08145 [Pseudoxanthomonas suwonensis]|nr:hypothetical protein [Pseudoxanthomonas suwonensis]